LCAIEFSQVKFVKMFDQLKDSVIRLAKEEEERKARQSNSGKKKKKRTKYLHMVVNAERQVLYTFDASPQYPEQVSVTAGDVVFVFESFEDGWSQVKKYSGSQGVIPTSYLGEIATRTEEPSQSILTKLSEKLKQRLKVLALMAVDQFKAKAASGAEHTFKAAKYGVTDLFIPSVTKIFMIVSRNESYTTTLSSFVRRCYEATCAPLIHSMSDEELAWYTAQLTEDSIKIKAEKARRLEAEQPQPSS
jgi:hypothetical protein